MLGAGAGGQQGTKATEVVQILTVNLRAMEHHQKICIFQNTSLVKNKEWLGTGQRMLWEASWVRNVGNLV